MSECLIYGCYSTDDYEYQEVFKAVSPLVSESDRTGFTCLSDNALEAFYDYRKDYLQVATTDEGKLERRRQFVAYTALAFEEVRAMREGWDRELDHILDIAA